MAVSGRFDLTDNKDYQWAWATYEEKNINTSANKSDLTVNVYYRRSNNGFISSGTMSTSVTVNGEKKTASLNFSNDGTKDSLVFSQAFAGIPHNADGSKKITVSVSASANQGFSGSASKEINLTAIPREAKLLSAPDFNDSNYSLGISYSNPAGSSVTELKACISLTGYDDIKYRDIPKTGTAYTFSLSEAEMNTLRNLTAAVKSRKATFYVRTKLGDKYYYSTAEKTFTVVNADPVFTAEQVSYADGNPLTNAVTGDSQKLIQNKSLLNVSFTAAAGQKYADISSYTVTAGDASRSASAAGTLSLGRINSSKNIPVTVRATDTRGYYKEVSRNITVLAYGKPVIAPCTGYGGIICERCSDAGMPDDGGEKLKLTVKGQWTSLPGKLNSGVLKLKYASKVSASDWIVLNGETLGGEEADGYISYIDYNGIAEGVNLSADMSYTVTLRCEDALGEYSEVSFKIPTEDICFHLGTGGNKAAFGKYAEKAKTLEIAEDWTLDVLGNISVKGGAVAAYTVETGTAGLWTYRKWSDGTAECWGNHTDSGMTPEKIASGVSVCAGSVFNLPENLFTADVIPTGSVSCWTYRWALCGFYELDSNTVRIGWIIPTGSTEAISNTAFIHIIGRWK